MPIDPGLGKVGNHAMFPPMWLASQTEEAACRLVSVHGFDHVPLSLEVAGNPRERSPITTMLAVVAIKA